MIKPNTTGLRHKLSPEHQAKYDAKVAELRLAMDDQFREANYDIAIAAGSVFHASDLLRKALDKVADFTKRNDCEGAAGLGYGDVSSAYIFLQRALGDLQSTGQRRDELISEIAGKVGYAFEDVTSVLPDADYIVPAVASSDTPQPDQPGRPAKDVINELAAEYGLDLSSSDE